MSALESPGSRQSVPSPFAGSLPTSATWLGTEDPPSSALPVTSLPRWCRGDGPSPPGPQKPCSIPHPFTPPAAGAAVSLHPAALLLVRNPAQGSVSAQSDCHPPGRVRLCPAAPTTSRALCVPRPAAPGPSPSTRGAGM